MENILVNEVMNIILLDFENSSQLTPVNCYLTDDFKPTSSLMDYGEYLVQSLALLTAWIERQIREEH